MALETAVKLFFHYPKRDFRFEAFYENGQKMWQASCQFEVQVELDSNLPALERGLIEYRQYIRGGVWVRKGSDEWTDDDNPNGNKSFAIPPYKGQTKVPQLPMAKVDGVGLSLSWKEDGQIESGQTERYGYRETIGVIATNEADIWRPENTAGHIYFLRDTPSIRGKWDGDSIEVWIELYFKGFVVEVELDETYSTRPVRVLAAKKWSYFWTPPKLQHWSDATRLNDVP